MKMLNVYYGQDPYNFTKGINHYTAVVPAQEEDIEYSKQHAAKTLKAGHCYWYLVAVVDVCPFTGTTSTETYYDHVPEKEKIILNKHAKGKAMPPPAPLKWPKDLDDLFDIKDEIVAA